MNVPLALPLPSLRFSGRRWLALATALILFVGGCAELPAQVERPVSKAFANPESTDLGALTQSARRGAGAGEVSGYLLLAGAQDAYAARLALVRAAQKTLDLQYYAIHADASSGQLLRAVHEAAGRGVKVRILLDDLHSTGRNASVMRLAFEPNIEMRMFNPLAGSRSSVAARMLNAVDDAGQLQQRMHNKLFLADNAMGVTGGRNLGDAYFGAGTDANFVDVDVLAAGPIVKDLSRSFDDYWNNQLAYPVQSLVSREEIDKIRADAKREREDEEKAGKDKPPAPDDTPMDLRKVRFVWAPAVMLADKPGKIPAGSGGQTGSAAQPGLVVRGSGNTAGPIKAAASDDDSVVDGLLSLFDRARTELNIVSPYFVPGTDMKRALAAARARGVKVRVLTNSLASNDAVAAHAGYARHREELLAMGVELHEMRSDPEAAAAMSKSGSGSGMSGSSSGAGKSSSPFGSSGSSGSSAVGGASRSMLHSKLLTIDGRLIVIGSMNLDLRSQLQNTEIALLIRSDELARQANERIEASFRTGSWRVEKVDGKLVWRAPEGSGLKDSSTEPQTTFKQRMMVRVIGPLAPDRLL
ncbi:phospholipase D family protein [Variovorax sp. OV329]|uniref:phospholipase D family protein n=1 Tax=Variovorax sp. OV329 TaxID=1882825 RepID=UPI0008EB6C9D|nr:phospholipase D family protein [Variovorax sp. OV329]SFN24780.1 Phosphatidylserine/phosphatidylglycerophosphate/cardiolipin synthase [Variovorax sp. OV329]